MTNASRLKSAPPITFILVSGIFLLLAMLYFPAIHGPFVLDDHQNVPPTNKPLSTIADVKAVALSNSSGPLGRPIPVVTFALNYHFFGSDTTSFKVVNLLIHATTAVVAFYFIRYLLSILSLGAWSRHSSKLAFAATLLWAIHPLQVSTVMYVVQRMTLLMTLFTLLSMLLYTIARHRFLEKRAGAGFALIGAMGFAVLACFSKENGGLIPLYVLLLELCIFRFAMRSANQTKVFRIICVAATIIGSLGIAAYIITTPGYLAGGYNLRIFSLSERLMTQLVVVTQYISAFYLPDFSTMSLFQDSFPISHQFGINEKLSAAFLTALVLAALLSRSRSPIFAFGILFYFASHVMESTIIPLEISFEHRNYIGTIGLSVALVSVASSFLHRTGTWKVSYILFPALAFFLALQTSTRVADWQDELSLATASAHKKPDSLRANVLLATILLDTGKPELSVSLLDSFTDRHPDVALPQLMAFYIQTNHGVDDPIRVKKIEQQLHSTAVSRDTVNGLRNLSDLFGQLPEQHPARDKILRFYDIVSKGEKTLMMDNEFAALHVRQARILLLDNKESHAINALRRATSLNPANTEIKLELAEALATASRWHQVNGILSDLKDAMAQMSIEGKNPEYLARFATLKKKLENAQQPGMSENSLSASEL